MKQIKLTIVFLTFLATSTFAQELIINSNRPGFSVSPYNVGKGIFQIESGFSFDQQKYKSGKNDSISSNSYGLDINLRYAISENLEIYTGVTNNYMTTSNYMPTSDTSDFSASPIVLGVAYRLNEGEGFIPTMAVRGGVMTYKEENSSYGDFVLNFATQHDFASNWVFITNWRASRIITNTELSYIFSVTNGLSPKWSWFIENMGEVAIVDDGIYYNTTNAGLAYLVNDNLQLDLFGGYKADFDEFSSIYVSVGLSWKLDKHTSTFNKPIAAENLIDPESENIDHKK